MFYNKEKKENDSKKVADALVTILEILEARDLINVFKMDEISSVQDSDIENGIINAFINCMLQNFTFFLFTEFLNELFQLTITKTLYSLLNGINLRKVKKYSTLCRKSAKNNWKT